MRRTYAALMLLLACVPAHAALDEYTGWLAGQPLTRLDGLVLTGQRFMEHMFLSGRDAEDTSLRREFDGKMSKSSIEVSAASVSFEFETNSLHLVVSGRKAGVPTADDCATLLDAARNRMLRSVYYSPVAFTADDRKAAARDLVSSLLFTPSRTAARGAPADMAEHLAAQGRVLAFVTKSDDILTTASCSGQLGGTDVDLKIR